MASGAWRQAPGHTHSQSCHTPTVVKTQLLPGAHGVFPDQGLNSSPLHSRWILNQRIRRKPLRISKQRTSSLLRLLSQALPINAWGKQAWPPAQTMEEGLGCVQPPYRSGRTGHRRRPASWDPIASESSFPTAVLSYPCLVPNSQRHVNSHCRLAPLPPPASGSAFLESAAPILWLSVSNILLPPVSLFLLKQNKTLLSF